MEVSGAGVPEAPAAAAAGAHVGGAAGGEQGGANHGVSLRSPTSCCAVWAKGLYDFEHPPEEGSDITYLKFKEGDDIHVLQQVTRRHLWFD